MLHQILNDFVLASPTDVVEGTPGVTVPFVRAGLNAEVRPGVRLEGKQSLLVVEDAPCLISEFRLARRKRDCQRDGRHRGLRATAYFCWRLARAVNLLESP